MGSVGPEGFADFGTKPLVRGIVFGVVVPEEAHAKWGHGDGHFAHLEAKSFTISFGEARGNDSN